MQFLGKISQIIGWRPLLGLPHPVWEILDPPLLGKTPKTWKLVLTFVVPKSSSLSSGTGVLSLLITLTSVFTSVTFDLRISGRDRTTSCCSRISNGQPLWANNTYQKKNVFNTSCREHQERWVSAWVQMSANNMIAITKWLEEALNFCALPKMH